MAELKTLRDIPQDMYGHIHASAVKNIGVRWIKEFREFEKAMPPTMHIGEEDKILEKYKHLIDFRTDYEFEGICVYDVDGVINWIMYFFNITEEDLKE